MDHFKGVRPLFANKNNVNQLMFVVAALKESAALSDDQSLSIRAAILMNNVLPRQTADGTWPEAGGFDIAYQLVTTELLTRYTSLSDPGMQPTLIAALTRGVNRWLQAVSPDGRINVVGARTMVCSAIPGPGPKGGAVDRQPLTLYYVSTMTNQNLGPIAKAVDYQGQNIDHFGSCNSAL